MFMKPFSPSARTPMTRPWSSCSRSTACVSYSTVPPTRSNASNHRVDMPCPPPSHETTFAETGLSKVGAQRWPKPRIHCTVSVERSTRIVASSGSLWPLGGPRMMLS